MRFDIDPVELGRLTLDLEVTPSKTGDWVKTDDLTKAVKEIIVDLQQLKTDGSELAIQKIKEAFKEFI